MKKVYQLSLLIIFILFVSINAIAQSLRTTISMPYIGLGAYTTKQLDPFSFTSNQAALAQLKTGGIGIFGERRFLLAENSNYGIANMHNLYNFIVSMMDNSSEEQNNQMMDSLILHLGRTFYKDFRLFKCI